MSESNRVPIRPLSHLPWFLSLFLCAVAYANAPSFPPEGTFPIGYWWGPPKNLISRNDVWRRLRSAEFSFCSGSSFYDREDNLEMLRQCAGLGMPSLVFDPEVNPSLITKPDWRSHLKLILAQYAAVNPNFGLFLKDEPRGDEFASLDSLQRGIREWSPSVFPVVNLYPNYAYIPEYEKSYMARFVSDVQPTVLLYDYYPFLKRGDRPGFFENLEQARRSAQLRGIPIWLYLQSWAFRGYRPVTEAQLRWQVYGALAYGVKGILYFTYFPDPTSGSDQAVVDHLGTPTRLYPIVTRLNRTVRTWSKTLLGLSSRAVYHTGALPRGTRALDPGAPVQLERPAEAVMGFLTSKDGKQEYLMLVNRNYFQASRFALRVDTSIGRVVSVSSLTGADEEIVLHNSRFELQLEPGAAALLRLVGK